MRQAYVGTAPVELPRCRQSQTRQTRRQAIRGAIAGTLGVTAAACGLPATGGPAAAPAAKLRSGITLQFVHFYGAAQVDNIQRRLALFEQDTPGIKVNAAQLQNGDAYRDKLATMFAANTPPDAMHMSAAGGSGFSFGVLAPQNRFFELTPLAKRDKYDLDDFYKVALDFNTFGGKLLVIPNDLNVFSMYWNVELFRQSGVTPPPDQWSGTAFDQGALLDAARRLTRREGAATDRYGIWVQPELMWVLPLLWSNGADVLSKDYKTITLDEPAALDTLQFITDLAVKSQAAPTADELTASGGGANLFYTGRLAMHHTGSNFVNTARTQAKTLSWDVGVSPRGKVRRYASAGGAGFAGAAPSQNREEAWALLKHLGGKASLDLASREGQMPTRRSVARSDAFLDPTQPPPHRRVFLDAAENAGPNPMVSNWNEVEAAIKKQLDLLFAGKIGVREAVAAAKREGEPLLAAGQAFSK
jgi:multiple sugar transport system substrate-binding protein